ncbi:queuosine salvage family protein [Halogeometricum limi]|uniref:Queuosine 5'-phosphate N-glycosylase/hydrolase n=1 Tax=Halogeometricum limi TaxID=555875 RepID=A0A1I6HUV9_9EURY|nr:queuosine salvage family protein [Halogeometricum limi]SFR58223.1 Potential Queuosine, Q, salvage protein family [Halogeometricum limi]
MNLVRDSLQQAPDPLDHIKINNMAISDLAFELKNAKLEIPEWRHSIFLDENDPDESVESVINYILVGNSINFQFRDYESGEKFRSEYNGQTWTGAFGMWACLKRACDNGIPITNGEYLQSLSQSDVENIFHTSSGPDIPLLNERVKILNQIGEILVNKYDGNFSSVVSGAASYLYHDGNGLLEILNEDFPPYRDCATIATEHGDREIHFLKRSQLAIAVLYGRFHESNKFMIHDPMEFTVFSDYNIPNILRYYDILEYDRSLTEKIDSGEFIEECSQMELELRIATIRAADRLLLKLNEYHEDQITAPQLDWELFQKRDSVDTKPHKSITTNY